MNIQTKSRIFFPAKRFGSKGRFKKYITCQRSVSQPFLSCDTLGELYQNLALPLDAKIVLKVNTSDNWWHPWHYLTPPFCLAAHPFENHCSRDQGVAKVSYELFCFLTLILKFWEVTSPVRKPNQAFKDNFLYNQLHSNKPHSL